jgi:quercetin dioxygenase-like cupin family protein
MFGVSSDAGYKEILPGISIKSLNYGTNSIMVEFKLTKGAVLPEHNHVPEQTGYLVKGSIRLFIDGKPKNLKPGDSWNIESNVRHWAEILEDSIAIEVFSPRRDDYLQYVRKEDVL